MKKIICYSLKCIALLFLAALLIQPDKAAAEEDLFYTYTYDYWGIERESPDAYAMNSVLFGNSYGIGNFNSPEGLFVRDNRVFICDTLNNRIVEFSYNNGKFTLVKVVTEVNNEGKMEPLSKPYDVFITPDNEWYISDYGNQRIVFTDDSQNVLGTIYKPEDEETLSADYQFLPQKLVVDSAKRIFVQAQNINKGFMEFENDGEFVGYIGAADVQFDFIDYFYKLISTQAQRAQMEAFVPTEYNNIALDSEGFIYATLGTFEDSEVNSANPVRKLNAKGTDILIRNGYENPIGDIQWGNGGGYNGTSKFSDVTILENDCYYCLDMTRGRVFGYDFQGNLLYAFGGIGYRQGNFKLPVAIEAIGDSLLILDKELGSVTIMTLTEYGKLINDALNTYKIGEYDISADYWRQVLKLNGNYDLAYIGIGRSLLRQDKFEEAMDYFKLKLDFKNYSKAYKLYRKEKIEDNIGYVFAIFMVLLVIIFVRNTVKKIRREVSEG
ncbi:MAG: hypothetical protein E7267_06060 [Lachnospiraceae bacterium]|nr:hypothetical protein [Lachnospiraceae bacterium]